MQNERANLQGERIMKGRKVREMPIINRPKAKVIVKYIQFIVEF